MKPYKARELPTRCDLSASAVETANDELVNYLKESGKRMGKFPGTLKVSTEVCDLVSAIDLARVWGFYLQLERKYEWDEWSITYDIDGGDFCVWSGGA